MRSQSNSEAVHCVGGVHDMNRLTPQDFVIIMLLLCSLPHSLAAEDFPHSLAAKDGHRQFFCQ